MSSLHAEQVLVVIPARMNSARLPGKPLLRVSGKPLVQHVYERAKSCALVRHVVVTSPDREICQAVENFGGLWMPSSDQHWCGTHRCAEVLSRVAPSMRNSIRTVINWQCDCMADPISVDDLIRNSGYFDINTLVAPLRGGEEDDPSVVKVVVSDNRCYWFSRAPLAGAMHHVGIYSFESHALEGVANLTPTPLSQAEELEQLPWLEVGEQIGAIALPHAPISINTFADFARFEIAAVGHA